jgi:hypothetical protein
MTDRKFALIVGVSLIVTCTAARAQHPCDAFAPYYHATRAPSLGSALADIFLFVGSAPMAVAIVGGPRRNVVNPHTGERRRVSSAACMPVSLVRHFRASQPDHAEHWQIE